MKYFPYGQKEIEHLKSRDKKLGAAMDEIGIIKRPIKPNPFSALVNSIISQQISGKAADTVQSRLDNLLGEITPENIINADESEIQACGMTGKKAVYIKGIAEAAVDGTVNFNSLHTLEDEEIIEKLSSLHGVGAWTAEMLLIFSLCRPDVVSYKDLAIRRGMMKLYNLTDINKKDFDRYRKNYSPYGSVASLYLWRLSVQLHNF